MQQQPEADETVRMVCACSNLQIRQRNDNDETGRLNLVELPTTATTTVTSLSRNLD